MKTLSYLSFGLAGLCLALAFLSHLFFDGRLIFNWDKFMLGVIIFLLTSIVFALYHLIFLKSQK